MIISALTIASGFSVYKSAHTNEPYEKSKSETTPYHISSSWLRSYHMEYETDKLEKKNSNSRLDQIRKSLTNIVANVNAVVCFLLSSMPILLPCRCVEIVVDLDKHFNEDVKPCKTPDNS